MKKILANIIFIFLLILTLGLGKWFSQKFENEKIHDTKVLVYPLDKNFIQVNEIKKMINYKDSILGHIDISQLENQLKKNRFVARAEVYKDLNNNVYAYVEQFTPIARVMGDKSYYIDSQANKRPLSDHYTENVILVFGNPNEKKIQDIYHLIEKINADVFLKEKITEIHLNNQGDYLLKAMDFNPEVYFGDIKNIQKKLNKLKTILLFLKKNHLSNKYVKIDLSFDNQIVCKRIKN